MLPRRDVRRARPGPVATLAPAQRAAGGRRVRAGAPGVRARRRAGRRRPAAQLLPDVRPRHGGDRATGAERPGTGAGTRGPAAGPRARGRSRPVTGTARQVRRAVRWLGGSVFAAALLQYVLFFAAARYLGDVDYGAFSLALAVATLAAPFCDLGTSVAIVCTGARCPAELGRRFGAALLLRALTAVPVFAAALGLGLLAGYGPGFAALLPPLYLATLADGAGNLGASACQAEERVATSALLQVARHLLRGGALLGTLWWGGGPHTLAWAFALASALGAAPAG
ncbi:MAG: hypothetical protein FJ265_22695, partial [Planctomycetes bacterium]|nr:hypothetical protein [Planctomycetota bacterium]